jgi:hypothetical protein
MKAANLRETVDITSSVFTYEMVGTHLLWGQFLISGRDHFYGSGPLFFTTLVTQAYDSS